MNTALLIVYHLFGSWNAIGYRIGCWWNGFHKKDAFSFGPHRMPLRPETNLLVDGPGGSGLTSFHRYIEKWNPLLVIAHHNHCGYVYREACRRGIPSICITRPIGESVRSLKDRYPDSNRLIVPYLRYLGVIWCAKSSKALMLHFNEVVEDPRKMIREINIYYKISLNEGDGVLPHERPKA